MVKLPRRCESCKKYIVAPVVWFGIYPPQMCICEAERRLEKLVKDKPILSHLRDRARWRSDPKIKL